MTGPKKNGIVDAWSRWKFTVLRISELIPIEAVNTVSASGSAQTLPDVTTATMHDVTLTANCTFTFPAAAAGKSFRVLARQDGTGSRKAIWPTTVEWPSGVKPTLTTRANAKDWLDFRCWDGSKWEGRATLDLQVPTIRVIQHASNDVSGGTSVITTLSSTPTPGNILLAFLGHYSSRVITSNTDPSNWTIPGGDSSTSAAVDVWARTVLPGDGTSWEFDQNATDSMSVVLVEIAGSNGTPSGWSFNSAHNNTGSVTNTLTLAAGQLALIFATSDGGTSHSVTTVTPTGFTVDESQIPSNHTGSYGKATGTGSSQSFTTAWNGTATNETQIVVGVT